MRPSFLYVIISVLCLIQGCKDKPYQEPGPLLQTDYKFSGLVEMGTPLAGAKVSAHKFKGLKRGDSVGEVITSPDGSYVLTIKTDYDGPLLLVAKGGTYRDLATKETVALKPEQELTSAITHIKMPEKTNINAWTTLAVARVLADQGFWDKSIAELKEVDRINTDFSQISYFLTGKSQAFVNIRQNDFFDAEKDTFKPDDPRAVIHLANGGLSRLAQDFSKGLAEEGVVVSAVDLVSALSEDLTDRRFDGRNAKGEVVYVGQNRRVTLNSYTMRKYLSEAMLLYAHELKNMGKLTEDDKQYIEMPGSIIDSLTKETKPELFPEQDEPLPLDKEAPTIKVGFAFKHKEFQPFSYLVDDVTFDVQTFDETKVQKIRMISPREEGPQARINLFGPIFVNQLPQAMEAAAVCGKEKELTNELEKREIPLENVICACFEASDIFENTSRELGCFQRPLSKAMIEFPTSNTVLSTKSFKEEVRVKAKVVGSLPLKECRWKIEPVGGVLEEGILPSGEGDINKTHCKIDSVIDPTKLFNGNYRLKIEALDMGGRHILEGAPDTYKDSVEFEVYLEPPTATITSPANNAFIGTNHIPIFGIIAAPQKVKSLVVRYRSADIMRSTEKAEEVMVALDGQSNEWSVSAGRDLPTGRYSFEVVTTDIYGNEKVLTQRTVTVDNVPPTIYGATDGILQEPYLQETVNYRQRFIDEPENPHFTLEPTGEAVPISWQRPPKIHRWLTRIRDRYTAPTYTIKAVDDNKLKEVRYSLNYRCLPFEEAKKTADQDGEKFRIYLDQRSASFDLGRDSEMDGQIQPYCLSVWAIDEAGNVGHHQVEFIWKVVSPPIAMSINTNLYRAFMEKDDLTYTGRAIPAMFRNTDPVELKKNLTIGHAILFNPHNEAVGAMVELSHGMQLSLPSAKYEIPKDMIQVEFYAYNLIEKTIGQARMMLNQSVIINPNEAILAKFKLNKVLPLPNFTIPVGTALNNYMVEVSFLKDDAQVPMIKGLRVITQDPSLGDMQTTYKQPWGDRLISKRKTQPRFGA